MPELFKPSDIADAIAHIEQTWSELTLSHKNDEGTLVGLPFEYIIPSYEVREGFAFREMYYWDSYFINLGLIANNHSELAEGMLENIIYLYKRFHIVPNASRFYMTSRSQPPIMTSMIFDIYDSMDKSIAWLAEKMHTAEREYHNVWTSDQHPNIRLCSNSLSRYYDVNYLNDLAEAESGWDMTTRFGAECLNYNPIDLNCLLYIYEKHFARFHELNEDVDSTELWRTKAKRRAETINKLMWDDTLGFYFDYNYVKNQRGEVFSLAGYYPLWAGLATQTQAQKLVDNLEKFINEGGLSTTARESVYAPRPINKQWAYPNGWAPLHWIVCEGLKNYGFKKQAEEIARIWINNNLQWYKHNNVFKEAYNVVDPLQPQVEGVYPSQIGFGWTNGVFIDLAKKYLSKEEIELI